MFNILSYAKSRNVALLGSIFWIRLMHPDTSNPDDGWGKTETDTDIYQVNPQLQHHAHDLMITAEFAHSFRPTLTISGGGT